ncbi:MAG: 50S ribosomal protein L11 methyltransferase [Pseudomonadota bacterium]
MTSTSPSAANAPTFKLTWRGAEDQMALIADLMADALDPPAEAVSLRKVVEDGSSHETDFLAEAYFAEPPDRDALATLIGHVIDAPGPWTHPTFEELPDDDWVKYALGSLGPVVAGRFILHGAHDRDTLDLGATSIPIEVEANQAFGTGHHPTTAGCLMLLDRLGGFAPKNIFDLGCGSAVLAIAAAKLWGRSITASDIDQRSVEIARENANHNGVGGQIDVFESAGFDHDALTSRAPYDFVFANILAGPLVDLSDDMATYVSKNGRVMLAGLMADQEAKVHAAYETAGFRQINRLDHPTWPVLLYVRQ